MSWWPDFEAMDAIDRAESDREQAANVLLIAAAYMRRGEALPSHLAEYLAGAIEASMGKPQGKRGDALLLELNLKNQNRRLVAYWRDVGEYMSWRMGTILKARNRKPDAPSPDIDEYISERGGPERMREIREARSRKPGACWLDIDEYMSSPKGLNLKADECTSWPMKMERLLEKTRRGEVEFAHSKGISQNKAAGEAAKKFGISVPTANNYYRQYAEEIKRECEEEAMDQAEHAIRQEEINPE